MNAAVNAAVSATVSTPVTLDLDVRLRLGDFVLAPRLLTSSRRIALFGASGSGKSLTLEVIAGLRRPSAGHVRVLDSAYFDAAEARDLPPQARRIGWVPQDYQLFPHMSAAGNVAFGLRRRRDPGRVTELLELVGLADQASQRPHALSGGQRQRVAFARALAGEPRMLLLDEPFSAIDEVARGQLRRLLADLLDVVPTPTVLVTHDLVEATMLADTIAVLRDGAIVQVGNGDDLMLRPANAYVADLVGMTNRMEAVVVTQGSSTSWVRWFDDTLEVAADLGPAGSIVTLGIRPEHVQPEAGASEHAADDDEGRPPVARGQAHKRSQGVEAVVQRVARQGLEEVVTLATRAGAPLEVRRPHAGVGSGPGRGSAIGGVAVVGQVWRLRLEPQQLWPLAPLTP